MTSITHFLLQQMRLPGTLNIQRRTSRTYIVLFVLLIFHMNRNVHGSNFLTLWESPCGRPFSIGWPWENIIHNTLHFLQHRDLAEAYIRRLGNVPIPSSIHFRWTSILPRNVEGDQIETKLISFYRGLNVYVILLQRLENNENRWVESLTIFSENSVVGYIHELQKDLLIIGCLLETTIGNKPRLEVTNIFNDVIINSDVAAGSVEGYCVMTEFKRFLQDAIKAFSRQHIHQPE